VDDILKFLDVNISANNGQATIEGDDNTIDDIFANFEETTSDFVFKKLFAELKGFAFEQFVAHILNIVGYNTRITKKSGDGGN
jgi:restriction system protein